MPKRLSENLILYDVEELSQVLGVQERTLRQLFRDGTLRGRKLARKWYMTEDDLKAYFRQEPAGKQETPAGGHQ